MIKKLSTKITRVFIENSIIQNEEKETYEYCFEIAIVSLISYSVLISTAIIFEEIICSCIFLFVFSLFRRICGGYHASTYIRCSFVSLFCYIMLLVIVKNPIISFEYNYLYLVVSLIIIIFLSPQEDSNKPITEKQYRRFKRVSKILAFSFVSLFLLIKVFGESSFLENKYFFSLCYGVNIEALSLIISALERRIRYVKI